MSRKIMVISSVLLFIIIAGSISYITLGNMKASNKLNIKSLALKSNDIKPVGNINGDYISDSTMIIKQLNYIAGIPIARQYTEKAGSDIVGLDKVSATEYYKKQGYLLTDFSIKRVVVKKDVRAWPPNYYVVKIENDKIKIYQTNSDSNLIFKNYYDMDINQLPDEDVNALTKGRAFESLEQINAMFDEYKS